MEQYIKKSDLVAEIKERIETYNKGYANGDDKRADALEVLLHDIANFEVKEVDLEKEYEEFVVDDPILGNFITNDTMGMVLAKHFFELGLNASQEREDVNFPEEECNTIYKDIVLIDRDGNRIKARIEQREKI